MPAVRSVSCLSVKDMPKYSKHPLNLTHYLDDRMYNRNSKRRRLYATIVPAWSLVKIRLPYQVLLYKFTDNGEMLIGFKQDSPGIVVYDYLGIEHLGNIYAITSLTESFLKVFKHRYTIDITTNYRQSLCGDTMLFTENGKHMLVLADGPCTTSFDLASSNHTNESAAFNRTLRDYQVICIEISTGLISDKLEIMSDDLGESHSALQLWKSKLAILSRRHQSISLYNITSEGKFVKIQTIGRFCHKEDEMLIKVDGENHRAAAEDVPFSALKHRLISFLWSNSGNTGYEKLKNFYKNWNVIDNMRMVSFQFLDEETLLIKFRSCVCKSHPSTRNVMLVFYNMSTTQIEALSDEKCPNFQKFVDENIHDFVLPTLTTTQVRHYRVPTSASVVSRLKHHHKFLQTSGEKSGSRDTLSYIPFPCQNVHMSPYLDNYIFKSAVDQLPHELGRIDCQQFSRTVRFLLTNWDGYPDRFGFDLKLACKESNFISLVFHPYEPLIITNEIKNDNIIINLHFRSA